MTKLSLSLLLALVLFMSNPGERAHQEAIASKVSFLGELGTLTVASASDYVNLGLCSMTISKRTDEALSFGILGKVWRL